MFISTMKNTMEHPIPAGIMGPEAERYFGVILEDISRKFDFLIEGFANLDIRIERLEARMDRLEIRMDSLEGNVLILEHTLQEVKIELQGMRSELKKKITSKEFFALEKRVTKLEVAIMRGK